MFSVRYMITYKSMVILARGVKYELINVLLSKVDLLVSKFNYASLLSFCFGSFFFGPLITWKFWISRSKSEIPSLPSYVSVVVCIPLLTA